MRSGGPDSARVCASQPPLWLAHLADPQVALGKTRLESHTLSRRVECRPKSAALELRGGEVGPVQVVVVLEPTRALIGLACVDESARAECVRTTSARLLRCGLLCAEEGRRVVVVAASATSLAATGVDTLLRLGRIHLMSKLAKQPLELWIGGAQLAKAPRIGA